jgi:hypothetical protein
VPTQGRKSAISAASIAFGAWSTIGEGRMSNIPAEKRRRYRRPLVAPIPEREGVRYVPLRRSLCKAPFVLLSALWLLGVQNRNLRRKLGPSGPGALGDPQTNPQISWASLIPSPSLFSSAPSTPLAHPQASLAKSTLRAPHPTLNTRRIRSVILSETLTSEISSHPSLNQHSCSFFAETTLHDYFKHTLVSNLEFTKIRIRL